MTSKCRGLVSIYWQVSFSHQFPHASCGGSGNILSLGRTRNPNSSNKSICVTRGANISFNLCIHPEIQIWDLSSSDLEGGTPPSNKDYERLLVFFPVPLAGDFFLVRG
jgi:hypothetical protein